VKRSVASTEAMLFHSASWDSIPDRTNPRLLIARPWSLAPASATLTLRRPGGRVAVGTSICSPRRALPRIASEARLTALDRRGGAMMARPGGFCAGAGRNGYRTG
jgi:hypothetical protein